MKYLLLVLVAAAVVLVLAVESVFHGGRPGRARIPAEPPIPGHLAAEPVYVGKHRLTGDDTHRIDTRFWQHEVELVRAYAGDGA
jgi:hypothetical protein